MTDDIKTALKDVRERLESVGICINAEIVHETIDSAIDRIAVIESQLADAEPVAFEMQIPGMNRLTYIRPDADPYRPLFPGPLLNPGADAEHACQDDPTKAQSFAMPDNQTKAKDGYRCRTGGSIPPTGAIYQCSFCDAKMDECAAIVPRGGVAICDKCVDIAAGYVADYRASLASKLPIAQLAGPGDEERREALADLEVCAKLWEFKRTAFLNASSIDTIRITLQAPAVPAGVTVDRLCEIAVGLSDLNSMSDYNMPEAVYQMCDDYAPDIAAALEHLRKQG